MKRTIIVYALLMAGCVAPGELRQKTAALDATSSRSGKTVAGCIVDRWEAGGNRPSMVTRPTERGYSILAEVDIGFYGKDTSFVIDVEDSASGSRSRLFSNLARASDLERVSGIVRDCQR